MKIIFLFVTSYLNFFAACLKTIAAKNRFSILMDIIGVENVHAPEITEHNERFYHS